MFHGYAGRLIRWLVERSNIVGMSSSFKILENRISYAENTRSRTDLPQLHSAISEITALNKRITSLEAQLALSDRHQTLAFWSTLDRVYDHLLVDRTLSCVVCGHANKREGFEVLLSQCVFDGGKLERYRCPECECIFGAQKFLDQPESMVDLDYKLLYSRYREGDTSDVETAAFHSIFPRKDGAYVNWGCGLWNDTITRLRTDGWNVTGYEPSAGLSSGNVVSSVDQLPMPLTGIFSNNVIEHFLDPVAQFREFYELLPTGGRMAHSTACYDYRYDFTRFHTVFLTGKSPEILAERTGFKIVDRSSIGEHINVVFEKL